MHVIIETKALAGASRAIKQIFAKGPVADKDNNNGCLVASKKDGSVTMESANQGLYVKLRLPAEVEEAGKVVIDRAALSNLRLTDAKTTLKHKDASTDLGFRPGGLKGTLKISQDFDEINSQRPSKIPEITVKIESNMLREGIKRVLFSSNDEDDPLLKLQLSFQKNKMILTTNDHYRAAMFSAFLEDEIEIAPIMIPAAFFFSVVSAIPADTHIHLGINDSVIRIKGEGLDVCHPVLQDASPVNMEKGIEAIEAEPPNVEFLTSVAEAREAILGVGSIIPSNTNIRMNLTVGGKKAVVKVESSIGKADCWFPVSDVKVNGDEPVKLSSHYMQEFLGLMGDGEIQVRVWDKPIIMRSQKHGTTLVMPQLNQ